jgi:hypothetical protein
LVGPSRHFIPKDGESLAGLLERCATTLRAEELGAALVIGFGHHAALKEMEALAGKLPATSDWPFLLVGGRPTGKHPIAGLQVISCLEVRPERLLVNDQSVGTLLLGQGERHCLLGGILPEPGCKDVSHAAEQVFRRLEQTLNAADFGLEDLVRTWFYNHRLLTWYDSFNAVRRKAYANIDFRTGAAPASTGIDGSNTADAALVLGAWAMQGGSARPLPSPLQCPAPAYGSSFSRAMELEQGGLQRVIISGTASIAEKGESLWRCDPFRQIETTMEVVQAIAASRGLSLRDTDRAIAYFKHGPDLALFRTWLDSQGLSDFPFIAVESDICRDELLFELELDLLG